MLLFQDRASYHILSSNVTMTPTQRGAFLTYFEAYLERNTVGFLNQTQLCNTQLFSPVELTNTRLLAMARCWAR